MRLHASPSILAMCTAALALSAGVFVSPKPASAQDGEEAKQVTVSGTCVNPGGGPAANLAVMIQAPARSGPPLAHQANLSHRAQDSRSPGGSVLAKGVIDDAGRFALKIPARDRHVVVRVGDPLKTNWAAKFVNTEGKDTDVGTIQLKPAGQS